MRSSLICARLRGVMWSMLSEKESGAFRDMLRHIDLAEQFAHGHSYEKFARRSPGTLRRDPEP